MSQVTQIIYKKWTENERWKKFVKEKRFICTDDTICIRYGNAAGNAQTYGGVKYIYNERVPYPVLIQKEKWNTVKHCQYVLWFSYFSVCGKIWYPWYYDDDGK